MDTFTAIERRRAVKHYDPAHRLSAEEERRLLSLAMLSPTAFNLQHWRFVVVKDPELRKKIRSVAWDQAQVTDASLLIVLCADLKAWEREPSRYWAGAPQEVQDFLLPAIDAYYRDKPRVERDEAMRSCGIAAQTLMLAAKAMGYDSCPMDGFDFDAVGELIGLPEDHVIAMFVAIGKGTKEAWPRPGQLSYEEVVLENTF
ncbi:MAG: nitroreductase family protein [Planctomycetota bacterium]|nr:MAG: nitroreductase family protein [Planctomycetota bacterium]